MITNDVAASLPWDAPPLSYLNPEQQVQFKTKAEIRRCKLGELLWSEETPDIQLIVLAGKVRLVADEGRSILLKPGEWVGELLELPGWKARAASNDVQVVQWSASSWAVLSSPEIERFWSVQRGRYQPQTDRSSQPVTGFPFVSGVNTAAACLTMAASHLQMPVQLDKVQRQIRGQRPNHLVEAAEKSGLHLRRIETNWQGLRLLSFPAIALWQGGAEGEPHWVMVYGVRGDRLIMADPLDPTQTCQSVHRSNVEPAWDGQLWQVELVQKQERFNLSWFLPAVWSYRRLLGEVLFASFTLQLLGLATPLITQVVIDKVMVQGSIPTLDVMAIALLSVAIFEALLGILRLFIFTHTARRLRL
ncbi:MAG: hypothetical protein HC936_17915 [Leptolyngbyaceae cyanobacterium SU_3_3]|nr:hypothetical protein [Leptolyngbyaceae cyanobacterium SU_3_3]